jgi:hypothetical protein
MVPDAQSADCRQIENYCSTGMNWIWRLIRPEEVLLSGSGFSSHFPPEVKVMFFKKEICHQLSEICIPRNLTYK